MALERELARARKTEEKLKREKAEAEDKVEKLLALSSRDDLTEIANRRCFDEFLRKEWGRSTRTGVPVSLILCDIDHFKLFNDHYGHREGDKCLCRIARVINEHAKRGGDLAARYGGEEFILILPDTKLENALNLANRIRQSIEELTIEHKTSKISKVVTASLGVATMIPTRDLPPGDLVEKADAALYAAKLSGRNKVSPKL